MTKLASNWVSSLQHTLDQAHENQQFRRVVALQHHGKWVEQDGRRLLNLSSNDYLSIGENVAFQQQFWQSRATKTLLMAATSSRLLGGTHPEHAEIERELCRLYNKEAALIFNSGYHANIGILSALTDTNTLILADKLSHASIIDGMKLASAKCFRFRHNDMAHLKRLLEQYHGQFERILIVSEGIFSMDGDRAPLNQLIEFKRQYPEKIALYLDEAHSFGVLGETGLGLAEMLNLLPEIDFLIAGFGKALHAAGSFIVCDEMTKNALVNRCRPFIYSTALSPLHWQWVLFVLQKLKTWRDERDYLHEIARDLAAFVREHFGVCPSESPIIPLILKENHLALAAVQHLHAHGFYAHAVRHPTVPKGQARLRLSLQVALNDTELQRLKQCLLQIKP